MTLGLELEMLKKDNDIYIHVTCIVSQLLGQEVQVGLGANVALRVFSGQKRRIIAGQAMRWAVWVQELATERPRLALGCFGTLLLLILLSSIWGTTSSMRQSSTTLEITVDAETTIPLSSRAGEPGEPMELLRSELQQLRKEVREVKELLRLGFSLCQAKLRIAQRTSGSKSLAEAVFFSNLSSFRRWKSPKLLLRKRRQVGFPWDFHLP